MGSETGRNQRRNGATKNEEEEGKNGEEQREVERQTIKKSILIEW